MKRKTLEIIGTIYIILCNPFGFLLWLGLGLGLAGYNMQQRIDALSANFISVLLWIVLACPAIGFSVALIGILISKKTWAVKWLPAGIIVCLCGHLAVFIIEFLAPGGLGSGGGFAIGIVDYFVVWIIIGLKRLPAD